MTLFSGPVCLDSHCVRIILAEKNIAFDTVSVETGQACSDLEQLNPYHTVPTLVDRNVVLYAPRVIMEYLEERFPYPPLMPVDPAARARLRLSLHHIETDWHVHFKNSRSPDNRIARRGASKLKEMVIASVGLFKSRRYFMYDEFTLLDCCVASVLWRLQGSKLIDLKDFKPVAQYAKRVFDRPAFRRSLTEDEAEMEVLQ